MSDVFPALRAGLQLTVAFNPIYAAVFSAVAAALAARPGRPGRTVGAVFVLLVGWLLGDGMRIIASLRDLVDGLGSLLPGFGSTGNVTVLVAWAVGSFALGYALPAWAGAFVGRRVTWGTGWIAALAVSLSTSAVIATLAAAASRALG